MTSAGFAGFSCSRFGFSLRFDSRFRVFELGFESFLDSSSLIHIGLLCEKEDPGGCRLLGISVIAFNFCNLGLGFSNWVLSLFKNSSLLMQISLLCVKEDPSGCRLLGIYVIMFDFCNLGIWGLIFLFCLCCYNLGFVLLTWQSDVSMVLKNWS
ncbi:hypothetical protein VIGAN_11068900, partial [Vigna angularis var. angularis]